MSKPVSPGVQESLEPVFNTFLRCPLPPVAVTPDSLRQYYRGSLIPQNRLMTPANLSAGAGGGTITNNVSGGSSTTINNKPVVPNPVVAQNAAVTTTNLDMGEQFFGIVTMSKTFQLLQVAVSSAARLQLYATAAEQTVDASRPDTTTPPIGVTQGLIADFTLDDASSFLCTWIPTGANGDFPRTTNIYVTITNLATTSVVITATLLFVPNEP